MHPPDTAIDSDALDHADMAAMCAGRDAALDSLMARHAGPLCRFLIRLLQDDEEAADLAQTAFVRVFQNRERFDPANKFSTWLYAIAANLARDRQRWQGRHPQVSLDAAIGEDGSDVTEILPHDAPGPAELADAAERAKLVRTAVAALPEDLRVPLVLAEYEGMSQADIGAVLECSAKAVELRIYRARQQLRQSLATLLPSEP
jgi:RNA polymerase sigma-70 factor (ECF subfamily)